jgi:cellulose synthase/poly-beta-1,6-N-acetylglucosamine synthase-like glycosyltransferase
MEIFYRTLEIINYICCAISTVLFAIQLIYILFIWLPPKHFKESTHYHKMAVLIVARNESDVIGETVKSLLDQQTYPKDRFDVFVCADNCTDDTEAKAKAAGAITYTHSDPDPAHHRAAFPVQYAMNEILKDYPGVYDAFIRFDADNHACPDYLKKMNDAFSLGCDICRPFESSTNPTQNNWTKVSAIYYIRDSRIACNFRERCHMDSMLTGAGMLVSTKIIQEIGGWDALSMSDDSEFTMKRMMGKHRIHYVADAIVYEDQPSNAKDTFARVSRMGHGLNDVFWKIGWRFAGHFFVSGRISFIDLFFQMAFVPIGFMACTWYPCYYIYYILGHLINAFVPNGNWLGGIYEISGNLLTAGRSQEILWTLLWGIVGVIASFYVIYVLQAWLALMLSKKHLGLKSLKGYWSGIFLSPVFMVFYGIADTLGVIMKPKWAKVHRNPGKKQ